jgi:hypothetical protein
MFTGNGLVQAAPAHRLTPFIVTDVMGFVPCEQDAENVRVVPTVAILAPLQLGGVTPPPPVPVLQVIVMFAEVPPAVVNDVQPETVMVWAVATFAKPNAKAANNAAPPRRLGKREVIGYLLKKLKCCVLSQRQFASHAIIQYPPVSDRPSDRPLPPFVPHIRRKRGRPRGRPLL